jgi:hypothetical protein
MLLAVPPAPIVTDCVALTLTHPTATPPAPPPPPEKRVLLAKDEPPPPPPPPIAITYAKLVPAGIDIFPDDVTVCLKVSDCCALPTVSAIVDALGAATAAAIVAAEGAATAAAISEFRGPTPGILSTAIMQSPLR